MREFLFREIGVIYHEGEQCHSEYYTLRVNMDNTWFLISYVRV